MRNSWVWWYMIGCRAGALSPRLKSVMICCMPASIKVNTSTLRDRWHGVHTDSGRHVQWLSSVQLHIS